MRRGIVLISDREAHVHRIPNRLERWIGYRHTFTPIVRVGDMWLHRYTGRHVPSRLLDLLELLPIQGEVRQLLLAEALDAED